MEVNEVIMFRPYTPGLERHKSRPYTSSLAHQRLGFEDMRPRWRMNCLKWIYCFFFVFRTAAAESEYRVRRVSSKYDTEQRVVREDIPADEAEVEGVIDDDNCSDDDGDGEDDDDDDDDETSLDIRDDSGESYEDMVSILPSEPVKYQSWKEVRSSSLTFVSE